MGKGAPEEHREAAPRDLSVALITISSSRYAEKEKGSVVRDEAGDRAEALVKERGYRVVIRELVSDDIGMIRSKLIEALYDLKVDAAILMGGTGLTKRDVTIEAVRPLLDKELEGFGEILRFLSYQKVKGAAFLSRALAGTIEGKVVFCLPGSPDAVATALELLLPELPHAVHMAKS